MLKHGQSDISNEFQIQQEDFPALPKTTSKYKNNGFFILTVFVFKKYLVFGWKTRFVRKLFQILCQLSDY
jgi:hypothetical protein